MTAEFIDSLAKKLNTTKTGILKKSRGVGGGTWAHWQIWLAYAKYLSPDIQKKHLRKEENHE